MADRVPPGPVVPVRGPARPGPGAAGPARAGAADRPERALVRHGLPARRPRARPARTRRVPGRDEELRPRARRSSRSPATSRSAPSPPRSPGTGRPPSGSSWSCPRPGCAAAAGSSTTPPTSSTGRRRPGAAARPQPLGRGGAVGGRTRRSRANADPLPGVGHRVEVAAESGTLSESGLRRVLVVLCVTEIVSWGVLYYAFPVLAPSIADEHRLVDRRDHRRVLHRPGGVRARRHPGRAVARPRRTAPGHDGRVGARRSRRGRYRRGPDAAVVLRRVDPGRRRHGRHALPARVRRADPLVGTAPGHRADRPHPARRTGQHDLRAADRRPARAAGVAPHLPRPRRRPRRCSPFPRTCGACGAAGRTPTTPSTSGAVGGRSGRGRAQPRFPAAGRRGRARHVHRVRGRGEPGTAADRTRHVHQRRRLGARPRRARPGPRPARLPPPGRRYHAFGCVACSSSC